MRVYHFHCTDGYDLVIDKRGRKLRSEAEIEAHAKAAARRVMGERRSGAAPWLWAGWLVCVHDDIGEQVAVIPFRPEEQDKRHETVSTELLAAGPFSSHGAERRCV